MTEYKRMTEAKNNTAEAIRWNELPNGRKYQNDTFEISTAHSNIKLVRSGQQACGGPNYWNSPDALSAALLNVIASDKSIIERAIDLLKEKERQAIVDCRSFAEDILEKVNEAEKEK